MAVRQKRYVEKLKLYQPAKTLEAVSRERNVRKEDIIKLAGNENRLGCSDRVKQVVQQAADRYSFYPDMCATRLRTVLAGKHDIAPENLIFGNGSFELISLVGAAYIEEGDETISADPSFGWYINVTEINGGIPVLVPVNGQKQTDLQAIRRAVTDRTKIIWLCNPNNPTGTLLPAEELWTFVEELPEQILLVLDEAYIDFVAEEYPDTVSFVKQRKNVLILRTFSKMYGLASFRIGYGIADKEVIEALEKVKLPINVNMLAQEAALAALEDEKFTERVRENNRRGLDFFYQEFEKLGMECIPSQANFVLVHTFLDGKFLEEEFLKRAIIVRAGADFHLTDWLRITVGTQEDNHRVIAALQDILQENGIAPVREET